MEFQEFKDNFLELIWNPEDQTLRKGQSLMIFLHEIWSKEYHRISSMDYYPEKNIDCFYNDKLIDNTFTHLEKEWKNYPN